MYLRNNDGKVVIGGPLAYRASLDMDKRLDNFVQTLVKGKIVNKISSAPNDADKISEYFKAKKSLGEELSAFKEDAVNILREDLTVVEEKAYSAEEAICVILICMMTGIELNGMIMNHADSIECLVDNEDVGYQMWEFLGLYEENLNNFSEEELIERFFN